MAFGATTHVSTDFTVLLRNAGFTAAAVFDSPLVQVWRKLPDRENCTWEFPLPDGGSLRLHVKRFPALRGFTTPAEDEATGYRALEIESIPSAKLVAWGILPDRRSFIITLDLNGYRPADKLVESGMPFERLLGPTADLAARLHNAGLHHRDLYLCHFLAGGPDDLDLRLIDAARVRRLPGFLTRRRWIVKDLAQFWFSTTLLPVTEAQHRRWLERYCQARQIADVDRMAAMVQRKSDWIGRHDEKLRRTQPNRNVSIPGN